MEDMTFDAIMQRMLDRVPDDLDKREGSVIWDALAPAALEFETAALALEYIFLQSFADTADREALVLRARERGMEPEPATQAVLKGEFTPTDVDVSGKRFNISALNYVVGDAIEGEAGCYQMICETPGADGHKILGTMIPIDYVEGLESATATETGHTIMQIRPTSPGTGFPVGRTDTNERISAGEGDQKPGTHVLW